MAQHNPFLDRTRDIVQGKSDDDILADWEERKRRSVERIASLGPGEAYQGTIEELAEHLYAGADARIETFSVHAADIKSHYVGEATKKFQLVYSQITERHAQGNNIVIEIDEMLLPEDIRNGTGSLDSPGGAVETIFYGEAMKVLRELSGMERVTAVSVHEDESGKEYRIIFCNGPDKAERLT